MPTAGGVKQASELQASSEVRTPIRDSVIADGGVQEEPDTEEIGKRSGNTQSVHASASGADRKCGKKRVVESFAVFGLACTFFGSVLARLRGV